MKRGDVYWAELVPRSGSEQTGRRPVVIVSHDGFNRTPGWRSTIVVPISTPSSQGRRGPTVIELLAGTVGLTKAMSSGDHPRPSEIYQESSRRRGLFDLDILGARNRKGVYEIDTNVSGCVGWTGWDGRFVPAPAARRTDIGPRSSGRPGFERTRGAEDLQGPAPAPRQRADAPCSRR